MRDLERGDVWKVPVAKGIWTAGRDDPRTKRRDLFMTCPECGMVMSLRGVFRVASDGGVTPSAICGCGFHDLVKLKGWRG